MAKGTEAKIAVAKILEQSFGDDFIGEADKKIYVWAKENGEKIKIAITLTCPKAQVGEVGKISSPSDKDDVLLWSDEPSETKKESVEISQKERQDLKGLMLKLRL